MTPTSTKSGASKFIILPSDTQLPPMGMDEVALEHMASWFDCMLSRS